MRFKVFNFMSGTHYAAGNIANVFFDYYDINNFYEVEDITESDIIMLFGVMSPSDGVQIRLPHQKVLSGNLNLYVEEELSLQF